MGTGITTAMAMAAAADTSAFRAFIWILAGVNQEMSFF